MSSAEQLRDRLAALLDAELPIQEGPYVLSLRPLHPTESMEERWGGQPGPVLLSEDHVVASFGFTGVGRFGGPWETSAFATLCRAAEDPARAEARAAGFVRAARRTMSDSTKSPFSDKPWFDLMALCDALREVDRGKHARARSAGDFAEIFLKTRALREHLLPEAAGEDAVARLDAWVAEHEVLARNDTMEISFVPSVRWSETEVYSAHGVTRSRHGLHVSVQLVVFESRGGKREVRDIKQQQLLLGPAGALGDPDRLIAFLDGWARVLPRFVAERVREPEALMPHDFLMNEVLALKRPRTADDFAVACLRRWKLDP
ncbi:MAG: hypothetical protein QM820_05545 [Minicystis sp.]